LQTPTGIVLSAKLLTTFVQKLKTPHFLDGCSHQPLQQAVSGKHPEITSFRLASPSLFLLQSVAQETPK
jgi:hypothetical protein